jgi:hypothetical protein
MRCAMELNPGNTYVVMCYGGNGSSAYGLESGYANWLKMNMEVLRAAGRPTLMRGVRRRLTLRPFFSGLNDASFIYMKNRRCRLERL